MGVSPLIKLFISMEIIVLFLRSVDPLCFIER